MYDITPWLKKGNNTAGVMLGSGWWNLLPFKFFVSWDLNKYKKTGRPCVKAELPIRYVNGTADNIITDGSRQSAPGRLYETMFTRVNIVLQEWNNKTVAPVTRIKARKKCSGNRRTSLHLYFYSAINNQPIKQQRVSLYILSTQNIK